MNNPVLQKISDYAVRELHEAYGHAALAEGDNLSIISCFPGDTTIEITITETEDKKNGT